MYLNEIENYLRSSLTQLDIQQATPERFKQFIADLHERLVREREKRAAKPGPELNVEFSTAKLSGLSEAIKANARALKKLEEVACIPVSEPTREVEPESPCVVTITNRISHPSAFATVWEARASDGRLIAVAPLSPDYAIGRVGLAHKLADGKWVVMFSAS